jgi:broad specificity phosphatase PhoE
VERRRPHLLLLRHGETEWNRVGRLQGRDDSPLTARGLAQADALAAVCATLGVKRVLASPLGRARITAERIAAACGAAPLLRDGLAEMSFGVCAGLTLDDVRARFPGLLEARERDRWEHRWPEGEGYVDVLPRALDALAADRPLATDPPTVVVAHQSVNRALLHGLGTCDALSAMASEQSADVLMRLDTDRSLWHARLDADAPLTLSWIAGPPRRAAGSAEALRTQRAV